DLAADHVALALNNGLHVGGHGTGHHTELRTVPRQMRDLRAPNLVLARQTGDVGAGAADPATRRRQSAAPIAPCAKPTACHFCHCQGPGYQTVPVGTCCSSMTFGSNQDTCYTEDLVTDLRQRPMRQ